MKKIMKEIDFNNKYMVKSKLQKNTNIVLSSKGKNQKK